MSPATLIGLASGALTTTAWLPQVIRAFRTRSTRDFAWSWFAMFGVGVGGWLVYGIVAGSPSVIATNALTLALVLGLGSLKLSHTSSLRRPVRDRRERQNRSPAHIPAP